MEIAQYEGDRRRAAALLEDMAPESWQDTDARASMTEAIRDGAISGMSFRFTVRDEEWDGDNRTIKEVELHEVGPVVFPAYQATTVGVRSDSDPISQLVALIRADESLRAPLAAAA